MGTFRWGILGPGSIARKFADGLGCLDDQALVAVGSRDRGRAKEFADAYGAERAHGSYEALAADDGVDAIYVATPHPFHCDPTILCLEAGRPVLCEKPLAVNAREVARMVQASKDTGSFLMEAMWTRFLPVYEDIRGWLDGGAIGEPRMVEATFGFRGGWNPDHRLLDPDLAGGALLDVGIYVLSFAFWVFGEAPEEVRALGHLGETGVDEQTGIVLKFSGGRIASLTCAVRTKTMHDARIYGTDGHVAIDPSFWRATTAHLVAGEREETAERPHRGNGYEYEAIETAHCVGEGLIESPGMTHAQSRELMATMDEIRAQLGLRYPFEEQP